MMAEKVESLGDEEMDDDTGDAPMKVTFPDAHRTVTAATPSLKLQLHEEEAASEEKSSSNMWQVYALGGFMILSWIWARWREKKAKGRPSEPSS